MRFTNENQGFLARPIKKASFPGIVIIHEYWGLNEQIKETASDLAANGYAVLAIDLFHGHVTNDPERAMKLVRGILENEAVASMRLAVEYLRKKQNCEKIAVMGWCFGGGQALKLAVSGERLDGTVVYYGNLVLEENLLRKISWPVLGIFGAEDEVVPVKQVKEFEKKLQSLQITNEIYIYPNVGHAFANPSNPDFAEEETRDAWEKTLAFLKRNLKSYQKVKVKIK